MHGDSESLGENYDDQIHQSNLDVMIDREPYVRVKRLVEIHQHVMGREMPNPVYSRRQKR